MAAWTAMTRYPRVGACSGSCEGYASSFGLRLRTNSYAVDTSGQVGRLTLGSTDIGLA